MPPKPMFMRITPTVIGGFEAAMASAQRDANNGAGPPYNLNTQVERYAVIAVAERSLGTKSISSVNYWLITHPVTSVIGQAVDTTTAWASVSVDAGLWDTFGSDSHALVYHYNTLGTGVQFNNRYKYNRFYLASKDESRILVSPIAWPMLNTASAWIQYTVPALRFAPMKGQYLTGSSFESLALSDNLVHGSNLPVSDPVPDNHLSSFDDRAALDLARIASKGSFWYGIKGNNLYVSYDGGTTWSGGASGVTYQINAGDDWTDVDVSPIAVACGQGTAKIAASDDGGTTWQAPTVPGGWAPKEPRLAGRIYNVNASAALHESTDENGHSCIVIDQTPGASTILYNRDPSAYSGNPGSPTYPWQLVTVPVPSAANIWAAVAHVAHQPQSGPILWDFFIIFGTQGLIISRDGGLNWTAKTYADSPLS